MTDKINQWIKTHRSFVIYFLISVFVTLVDVVVTLSETKELTGFSEAL